MNLELEFGQLKAAWSRHPAEFLDTYLVHGVENPCLNPQSVIVRSLMIEALAPRQHEDLFRQERLYSAFACLCMQVIAEGRMESFAEGLNGETGVNREDVLPRFVREALNDKKKMLFEFGAVWRQVVRGMYSSFASFRSPFEDVWRERMEGVSANSLQLLEAACGSANDARFFPRYGLSAALDYTGVDLCAANIENARRRFPQGKFLEGDALQLPFPDRSFDYYLAFDLFEHLSLEAFATALGEAVRVARRGLWLSFFQLDWRAEHSVLPDPPYYRNTLSIPRTLDLLDRLGCDASVIDIQAEWEREFPGYRQYNPLARIVKAQVRD